MKVGPSKPAEAPEEVPIKQKELRFQRDLKKDSEVMGMPFLFDVLAQLANIPAHITLYELLCLSRTTKDILRDVLVDSDVFLAQIIEPSMDVEDSCPLCYQVMRQVPYIRFSPEDMHVKNIKCNSLCIIPRMSVLPK